MSFQRWRVRDLGCAVFLASAIFGCSKEKTSIHSPLLERETPSFMKWEPGHYFLSKLDPAQSLQGMDGVATMQGLQRQYYWSDLEPMPLT